MNPAMVRDFGDGVGSHCYIHLCKADGPCHETCRLPKVVNGAIEKWHYNLPDGRVYEILASPYVDSDKTICQLATFRDITQRKKVE